MSFNNTISNIIENDDQQQPSKKQKLDNHQTYSNNIDNYIDNIENLKFTLINLINIISQYNQIKYKSDSESISNKIKYIQYFNNYHVCKFPHYYNFNSFIDFVLDIFFDNTSIEIFEQIKYINKNYSYECLYNLTVGDPRFKEWFKWHYENDFKLLEYKFNISFPRYFNIESLHSKLFYNNLKIDNKYNNNNEIKKADKYTKIKTHIYTYGAFDKYYQFKNNNIHISDSDSDSDNNNRKSIIFPDYTIKNILGHTIDKIFNDIDKLYFQETEYYLYNISKLSNYPMVSKQFLKVFSNLFNHQLLKENYFYKWIALKKVKGNERNVVKVSDNIDNNNIQESSFKYINQRHPLIFNYEKIKSIPYNISKENLELMFSKVETFYINSDEFDININDGVSRDLTAWDNVKDTSSYRGSISSDSYLVIPPPMPSLKNIIVTGYYGFENNYSNFLINLITNCQKNYNNNYPESPINQSDQELEQTQIKCECNNCNGKSNERIEYFAFDLNTDWIPLPIYSDTSFFKVLLLNHSKSLKRIDIEHNSFKFQHSVFEVFDEVIGFENKTTINLNIVIKTHCNKPDIYQKYLKYKNQH